MVPCHCALASHRAAWIYPVLTTLLPSPPRLLLPPTRFLPFYWSFRFLTLVPSSQLVLLLPTAFCCVVTLRRSLLPPGSVAFCLTLVLLTIFLLPSIAVYLSASVSHCFLLFLPLAPTAPLLPPGDVLRLPFIPSPPSPPPFSWSCCLSPRFFPFSALPMLDVEHAGTSPGINVVSKRREYEKWQSSWVILSLPRRPSTKYLLLQMGQRYETHRAPYGRTIKTLKWYGTP